MASAVVRGAVSAVWLGRGSVVGCARSERVVACRGRRAREGGVGWGGRGRRAMTRTRARAVPAGAGAGAPTVLVPVAHGTEEIEAVVVADVMVRAGCAVTVASVETTHQITASRGVKLVADCLMGECTDRAWDLVVLPGGMPGATRLGENADLARILKEQHAKAALIGAICAAPAVVLEAQGYLDGLHATCHPAFVKDLKDASRAGDRVVVSGNVVTSKGPGTAIEFALALVELVCGKAKRDEVEGPMVTSAYSGP